MTREEAIKMLRGMKADNLNLNDLYTRDKYEALVMAIKALEEKPCEDCISRQEIIYELNRLGRNAFKDDTDYDNFFAFVDSLPSVTPKTDVLDKIRDEIENYDNFIICANGQKGIHIDKALEIIDKYKGSEAE